MLNGITYDINPNDQPDILISMSDANLLSYLNAKKIIYGHIVFNHLKSF